MTRLPRWFLGDLPGGVWLLVLAQAVNLTASVISVSMAALAGLAIAPGPAWATVPYGAQFAALLLFTWPASAAMARFGRRPVFLAGGAGLVVCGVLGYAAIDQKSFALLTAAHALLGAYSATANFSRFAAVDGLVSALRARALSLVVAGGVLAAVLGPLIAVGLRDLPGHAEFAPAYGALAALGLVAVGLMAVWRPHRAHDGAGPSTVTGTAASDTAESMAGGAMARLRSRQIFAAIFAAAGAYLMMNLLMVQSSLVMREFASFAAASRAIQLHVLAMFAPSFITGALIGRWGLRPVLVAGFVLLGSAGLMGLLPAGYVAVTAGLFLLGLGWNFAYVGAGALLTRAAPDGQSHRWQGINDTCIAASAAAGAFLPAPLLAHAGWAGSNLLMLPLCAAGAVLCWRALPRRN